MKMTDTPDPIARDLALLGEPISRDEAMVSVYQNAVKLAEQRGFALGCMAGRKATLARLRDDDAEFINGIVDELRRRELEDDQMDTSGAHEWIKGIIESLEAKRHRDQWDAQVRRERAERLEEGQAA